MSDEAITFTREEAEILCWWGGSYSINAMRDHGKKMPEKDQALYDRLCRIVLGDEAYDQIQAKTKATFAAAMEAGRAGEPVEAVLEQEFRDAS